MQNAACNEDGDCAKGQTCLGGSEVEEVGSCPEDALCILPPTPTKTGTCVNECTTDKDCASKERCGAPVTSHTL